MNWLLARLFVRYDYASHASSNFMPLAMAAAGPFSTMQPTGYAQ
jgi:hypothetical protein